MRLAPDNVPSMEPQSEAAQRAWRASAQSGLAAFLSARLDEDEQAAQEAGGAPWALEVSGMVHVSAEAQREEKWRWGGLGYVATVEHEWDRAHIARHNPARVLVEVAAKRRVVVLHRAVRTTTLVHQDGSLAEPAEVCHACDANTTDADWPEMPCLTLSALAEPYADHPDYQEGWRP